MKEHTRHQSHGDIVARLKRAQGHLLGTIAMIQADRSCAEIAQQLHAIERAVTNAKKALIHDHIDFCLEAQLDSDPASAKRAIAETKLISKYL
jgi:DNA-binding FrmR family transcriptional regulator